jgi:hypothetical protein
LKSGRRAWSEISSRRSGYYLPLEILLAICLRVDIVHGDLIDGVMRIMDPVESRLVITGRGMKDMEGYFVDILFARSHKPTRLGNAIKIKIS